MIPNSSVSRDELAKKVLLFFAHNSQTQFTKVEHVEQKEQLPFKNWAARKIYESFILEPYFASFQSSPPNFLRRE